MDAQFGKVIDELERLGLYDNTIVILWGDHGWKLGEHACWCKHTNFEIDARAPMLIQAPGYEGGQKTEALVEFVDMYPSLCELCGLPVPEHTEGTSFVPLMEDPNRDWKDAAFSQYPRGDVMGTTMRTDRYRYTEWRNTETDEVLARELYDHQEDPQENVNLAVQSDYESLIDGLAEQMARGWQGAKAELNNA
jgi:arylsulfatase A-like enzyme